MRIFDREMRLRIRCDLLCCGVTVAQCHTILEIDNLGEASVSVLAQTLGLDSSSMSRTIDGLVGAGYVKRIESSKDRRFSSLSLTEKGSAIVSKINEKLDSVFTKIFDEIPKQEHAKLIEAMSIITGAFKNYRKLNKIECGSL